MRILASIIAASAFFSPVAGAIEIKPGDRIVLLGNAFFEREGSYGHIETHLAVALAEKEIAFRNLGWSGDTVFCEARSYFGPPQEGFDRLKRHLQLVKPTLVIASYGGVAAFEGEAGIEKFVSGYKRLLDMVKETTGARIVLMSPPPCEQHGAPMPDMAPQNKRLALYRDRIKELAKQRAYGFVDLLGAMGEGVKRPERIETVNGVNYNDYGYRKLAPVLGRAMGIESAPASEEAEALRKLVIEKNRLFFNRWRPQNETYLLGFRKHEQGKNAKEIPLYDPLVAAKDKEIQKLAKKLSK
jgi:hypothetical protein